MAQNGLPAILLIVAMSFVGVVASQKTTPSSGLVQEGFHSGFDVKDAQTVMANLQESEEGHEAACTPVSAKQFRYNTEALLAYARAVKLPDEVPEIQAFSVLFELLNALKSKGSECAVSVYKSVLKKMQAHYAGVEGRGLKQYIIKHVHNSVRCSEDGFIQLHRIATYKHMEMTGYTGFKKYMMDGSSLGLQDDKLDQLVDWAVSIHRFQDELHKIGAGSEEVACQGCKYFQPTVHDASGPIADIQDSCEKDIDIEDTGFCVCEGDIHIRLEAGAHDKGSCDAHCAGADANTPKTPYVATLRLTTGEIEGGESTWSPEVSFGDSKIAHGISSLPSAGETLMYQIFLQQECMEEWNRTQIMHLKASNSLNAEPDQWYYSAVDLKIGEDGKFLSLGPGHSWLVAKVKNGKGDDVFPPQREFGGDLYGNDMELHPFETFVDISYSFGSIPHAVPSDGPTFWVRGSKFDDRWFEGGVLAPGGAGANLTQQATIRKDIGTVVGMKLQPANVSEGAAFFLTQMHVVTTSNHASAAAVHDNAHDLHPLHMFVDNAPFQDKTAYSFNDVLPGITLSTIRPRPAWDGSTCGGTAPKNSKCAFPFTFQGKQYNDCTSAGKSKYERWCVTETMGTWAYCDCKRYTTWKGTQPPGEECVFPFKKNGKWYNDCIRSSEFSPANELTYPCDSGQCSGAFADGVCSVDSIYKGRWGGCQPRGVVPGTVALVRLTNGQGPASGGSQCEFPFFYKNQWISDCIGDAYGGFGWCATSSVYNKDNWGGCRRPLPPAERYVRWPDDVIKYMGNNSAPDDRCQFPFRHHGGLFTDCVNPTKEMPHGWCSLDTEFNGRWGACAPDGYKPVQVEESSRWTNGNGTVDKYTQCIFPFTYRGKKYRTCVGHGDEHPDGWCSTTQHFANKWGACLPAGMTPPKQDCVMADWSSWSRGDIALQSCSGGCRGTTKRVRAVFMDAQFGGQPCPTEPEIISQTKECKNSPHCNKHVDGLVNDAMDGEPVAGVNVSLSCHAEGTDLESASDANAVATDAAAYAHRSYSLWTITSIDGSYSIQGVSAPADCQVTMAKEGYITAFGSLRIGTASSRTVKNLSMRKMSSDANPNTVSFILNWNSEPSDIDAHMIFAPEVSGSTVDRGQEVSTSSHLSSAAQQAVQVNWMDTGDADAPPYITLDHDEMNGKGPETITIHKLQNGEYLYYVKCYSCPPKTGVEEIDSQFVNGGVSVMMLQGNTQTQIPLSAAGLNTSSSASTQELHIEQHASGTQSAIWSVLSVHVVDGAITLVPHLKFLEHEPSFSAAEEAEEQATLAAAVAPAAESTEETQFVSQPAWLAQAVAHKKAYKAAHPHHAATKHKIPQYDSKEAAPMAKARALYEGDEADAVVPEDDKLDDDDDDILSRVERLTIETNSE